MAPAAPAPPPDRPGSAATAQATYGEAVSQDDATPTPDDTAAPAETTAGDAARSAGGAHPVLVYSLLRLLILGLTTGVLYLLGLRQPMILLVFAFLISGVISIFALNRRREVAAVEVVTAVQKVNQRIDSSAASEDAAVDAAQAPTSSAAGERSRTRDLPADDDLDDLEPTDRP